MRFIEKVGNISVYRDGRSEFEQYDIYGNNPIIVLEARDENGEVLFKETYFTKYERDAVDWMFFTLFGYMTVEHIHYYLKDIIEDDKGRFSGKMEGFDGVQVFERIGDTRFYRYHETKKGG